MSFVHLHVHSQYSLMRGTADLEKLCRAVKKRGMDTVALTDTNGVYGLIFFLQLARETGIRPVVGAEVVTDEARAVLLVKSREGYANLCRILTQRHCEEHFVLSQSLRDFGSDLVILSDTIPLLLDLKGRPDVYVELMGGKNG